MPEEYLDIRAPLGADENEIKFQSFQEIDEWLQNEESEWQWLFEMADPPQQQLSEPINIYRNTFKQLRQVLNPALQSQDSENLQDHINNVTSRLENFRNRKLVLSGDAKFGVIKKLSESNKEASLWALRYCLNQQMDLQQNAAVEAVVRLALSEIGVSDSAYGQAQSLKKLRKQYQDHYENLKQEISNVANEFDKDRRAHAQTYAHQQELLNSLFEETREKIEELERTYDEKLALLKPVEYWKGKAKNRYKAAGWLGFSFVLLCVVLFSVSAVIFSTWLQTEEIWRQPWRLTTVGLFIALMVWIIRLVGQFLRRQVSIADDAQERATMVVTYLALLRSGEGLEENDRSLILKAIFRPSQISHDSDESGPRTGLDVLGRLFGGR